METKTICYCVTVYEDDCVTETDRKMCFTKVNAEKLFKTLKLKGLNVRLSSLEVTTITTISEKLLSI